MNNQKALLVLILLLLPLAVQAATVSCSTKAACNTVNGEVEVLQLSDTTNAHGAVVGNGYPQKVCCTGIGAVTATLGTCPSGIRVLNLYVTTNAHAEEPSQTNYDTHICVAGLEGTVNTESNCNAETETCLVMLSAPTNAHLASCNSGSTGYSKICIPKNSSSQGQSVLMIESVVVPNPAYKDRPMDVVVTIVKNASALNRNVSGTIQVRFKDVAGTAKEVGITIPAGQSKTSASFQYTAEELAGIIPGIYALLAEALDEEGIMVASQTVHFSLAEPPGMASIPETNWFGTILVLACVLTIAFGLQKKNSRGKQEH